jgi:stage V sporulation protein AE
MSKHLFRGRALHNRQFIIDNTNLRPQDFCILRVAGVILGAIGLYKPIVDWAGAGATVPLTGFGYLLAEGVKKAVDEKGVIGIFTGGFTAAAGGICAAVFFGYLIALLFKPGDKS